jgi:tetratricopeptide (TPR) repeat protein
MIGSLTLAHKTLGERAIIAGKYKVAKSHFSKALNLSPKDTMAMFNQLMIQGHILYKSGKKDKLWDAIQVYHKAATILEKTGNPHYHIGMAYQKLRGKDFDLIIESYDRALELELKPELRELVHRVRSEVLDRDKRLKDFWK